PKNKISLPDVFPKRIHLADATIIVRNRPHDFIAEHVDLDLDPRHPGEIAVEKLQLVGGQTWLRLKASATYNDRKLDLRDLVLGEEERFRSIEFDASQIAARKLGINFNYAGAQGNISGAIVLRESHDSLDTNVRIRSENVPLAAVNKFAALPDDWLRGQVEKFDVDLAGFLSSRATWNGNLTATVKDFRQEQTAFDRGDFQVVAKNGVATLQTAEIKQQQNEVHVKGSSELPRDIRDFGHAPATLELAATLPDLKQVTAAMPQKKRGPPH